MSLQALIDMLNEDLAATQKEMREIAERQNAEALEADGEPVEDDEGFRRFKELLDRRKDAATRMERAFEEQRKRNIERYEAKQKRLKP